MFSLHLWSLTTVNDGHYTARVATRMLPARPALCLASRKVTVWEWTGTATDEGPDAAAWFTTYLGLPCRLVRYVGSGSSSGSAAGGSSSGGGLPVVRNTEPEFAVKYETRFSDGYPMLIVTQVCWRSSVSGWVLGVLQLVSIWWGRSGGSVRGGSP